MRAVICVILLFGPGTAFAYDPNHLNIVRSSDGNVCAGCDLVGAPLNGVDLDGKNLAGANLSYANLRGAILNNTNLAGANLSGATWVDGTICREGSIGYCLR